MEQKIENTKFKTVKRVLSLVLVAILLLLYASTMYFAITDDPQTMSCFWASVAMTIFVPVLLYAYQLVYRVLKGRGVSVAGNMEKDDAVQEDSETDDVMNEESGADDTAENDSID